MPKCLHVSRFLSSAQSIAPTLATCSQAEKENNKMNEALFTSQMSVSPLKCLQHKLDIAGTATEMHLLLF